MAFLGEGVPGAGRLRGQALPNRDLYVSKDRQRNDCPMSPLPRWERVG